MIEIEGLAFTRRDGGFRLRVTRLDARAGEHIGLVGASGSGKTTLANLIAGILEPDSGTLSVLGRNLRALDATARRRFRLESLGLVFQDFALIDYLSVEENALLPRRLMSGHVDADQRTRARMLAAEVGIEPLLSRLPPTLSQGERQRVAICRALMNEPRLLLADEPTGNLDPANARKVVHLLQSTARDRGAGLLMISHQHELLSGFDRVIDLTRLVEEGVTS